MSPSELKYNYETNNPGHYFFSRKTMKFFGDTMANFGVYSDGATWVLYRKKPTDKQHAEYPKQWRFCKQTFKQIL